MFILTIISYDALVVHDHVLTREHKDHTSILQDWLANIRVVLEEECVRKGDIKYNFIVLQSNISKLTRRFSFSFFEFKIY